MYLYSIFLKEIFMFHFEFILPKGLSFANAKKKFTKEGFHSFYEITLPEKVLGCFREIPLSEGDGLLFCKKAEVDWQAEWETHCGANHVILKEGLSFVMEPGAGFGDLGHPTSQLMVDMMVHEGVLPYFIDIGCGSGVLSLAALTLGAKKALSIDICPRALEHTKNNLEKNNLVSSALFTTKTSDICSFLEKVDKKEVLFAINMIFAEQKVALLGIDPKLLQGARVYASGILTEQEEEYIAWWKRFGCTMQVYQRKKMWASFIVV